MANLLEEEPVRHRVHHRVRDAVLQTLLVLARRERREAVLGVHKLLVKEVPHALRVRHVGHEVRLAVDGHLRDAGHARQDAEHAQAPARLLRLQVRPELVVAARGRRQRAHERDDRAVDQRRLDLRGLLLALGEGRAAVGHDLHRKQASVSTRSSPDGLPRLRTACVSW